MRRPNLRPADKRRLPGRVFAAIFQEQSQQVGVDRHPGGDPHHKIILGRIGHAILDIETDGPDNAHVEALEFRLGAAFGHGVEESLHLRNRVVEQEGRPRPLLVRPKLQIVEASCVAGRDFRPCALEASDGA